LLVGCQNEPPPPLPDPATTEAREDSAALAAAYRAQALILPSVTAAVETDVAHARTLDDAADDPAVWVHPEDATKSLVFGSNKTGGLAAYDLTGREVAYYPIGKINNVDVLTGVPLGDTTVTLLGCSNRTLQSVNLFVIDPATGALTDVAEQVLAVDSATIDDIYGFCLGRNGTSGKIYAIVNGKNGRMQQFRLVEANGKFALELVRDIAFVSQTEGMVTDNELGWLYVGEEGRGLWKLPLDPTGDDAILGGGARVQNEVAEGRVGVNPHLVADVEGLSLIETGPGAGYLVVSVQGNFSYAVFDRGGDNAYLGSFKITDGPATDGVEETDGLEVVAGNFGPAFPNGLLVVQDGFNYAGDTLRPQNFKLVNWGSVEKVLGLRLNPSSSISEIIDTEGKPSAVNFKIAFRHLTKTTVQ